MSKFIQLGEICNIVKGNIGITKAIEGKFTLVTTAEKRRTHNEFQFDKPAVIVPLVSATGHGHASIKRIHYEEEKYSIGNILAACIPKDESKFSAKFLYIYFSLMKDYVLVPLMKGSANVSLTITNLKIANVPNLKLERQLEIVNQFEKLEVKNNLLKKELVFQKGNLSQLRQAIFQEAVQGKLVPQDPNDEPASILLEKIKKEKAVLIKAKKIKKEKPLSPISEEEVPFELPEGWVWCRLGELVLNIDSGWSPKCHAFPASKDEWGVLKVSAVSWGKFKPEENKKLPNKLEPQPEKTLKEGDFLMTRANTAELIARSVIVEEDYPNLMMSDKILRVKFSGFVIPFFIQIIGNGRLGREYFFEKATGTSDSMRNVSRAIIKNLPVPLAPFTEQRRIMKKVKELLIFCDALDEQLQKSETDAGQLMQAVLQEAFGEK